MDPAWAAPIATLTGAISTAILMYAAYNWPTGHHRPGAEKDEDDEPTKPVPRRRATKSRRTEDEDDT